MKHVKYRPDIDGLRAIAVLAVIVYHAFPGKMPGGFIGVDIFFVISGYLISSIIFGNLEKNSFSYKGFYIRRIKRIFPALILILAVTFLFGWTVLFPHEFEQIGKHVVSGVGFVSNITLWNESGYFDNSSETKPLLHLWSLGIEEQFYIIWPMVLILAWNKKFGFLAVTSLIAAASFFVNIVTVENSVVAAFYSPFSRFWELMVGGLLAYAVLHRADIIPKNINVLSVIGALLIVTGLILLDESKHFPGWWAILPVFGTFLMIAAGQSAWLNCYVLGNPALVWIGLISYPLYLWHWPLLSFAHIFEYTSKEARIVVVIMSFVLASLTYLFLEKKVRISNDNKSVGALIVCAVVVLLVASAAWYGVLQPRNNSRGLDLVAEAVKDNIYTKGLEQININGVSVFKKTGLAKTVLFYGDSHMEQYAPRIKYLIEQNQDSTRSAIIAFRGGCPPIPGVYEARHAECNKNFREKMLAYALSEEVGAVVIAAWWRYLIKKPGATKKSYRYYYLNAGERVYFDKGGIPYALNALEEFITLIAEKKKVYLILDNPTGKEYDPQLFYAGSRLLGMQDQRSLYGNFDNKEDLVLREKLVEIANRANAIVIDPVKHMCFEGKCPRMLDDGTPIYTDKSHLRPFYIEQFASYIDIALRPE